MYRAVFLFIFANWATGAFAQHTGDTVHLYFNIDIATLSAKDTRLIDSLLYNDKIIPGNTIKIIGYADFLGEEEHNKVLSIKRAKNIEAYLVNNNIPEKNITLCIGEGEVKRNGVLTADGYPTDRKVDIVLYNTSRTNHNLKHSYNTPELTKINEYKPGQAFPLKSLYFFPERHTIRPESREVLNQLCQALADNPQLKIRIEGHVCCIVDFPDAHDRDNGDNNLSLYRAKTVYDFLVTKGISPTRLQYAGYGKSRPVVPEERTEEDANKNRRVEIRILKN